jgi:hypothetical protein
MNTRSRGKWHIQDGTKSHKQAVADGTTVLCNGFHQVTRFSPMMRRIVGGGVRQAGIHEDRSLRDDVAQQ